MRCRVCGAAHAACGPRTTVVPIDQRITTREKDMEALGSYEIRAGRRGEFTGVAQMTAAEAKRVGAKPVESRLVETKADKPANKSRTAQNKGRTASRSASKKAPASAAPKTEEPPAGGDGDSR